MHLGMTECPVTSLVIVTLTSDLVSRIPIESVVNLLYSLRKEFQIWYLEASLDGGDCHIPFLSSFDHDL